MVSRPQKGKRIMERKISIVIPAYNEAESVSELYAQIMASVNSMLEIEKISGYEIWFVSDGSTDGTVERVKQLIEEDENVHLIAFRKNFGKAKALNTAFRHVTGDVVFTMDADLQDDPVEFPRFLDKIDEGYDVVSGWKFNRLDPMEKKLPSKIFNGVTSKLTGIQLHDFDCGFKAYRLEVVKALDIYGDFHRYIPVLAYRKGYKIGEITVQHHKREHGKSKYGVERYLRGLFDSVTTTFLLKFSDRPMFLFGRLGIVSFMISGFALLGLICRSISRSRKSGTPLLIAFAGGILAGMLSIYTGLIGNMIVENTYRKQFDENHVKEII